ncbi:MAG: hypothetical protein ACPLXC_00155 [Candidatus Pacearchaeota archaeon]
MQLLIPDTNFLIYLVKFKMLDELDNYKLITIKQILEELDKITKAKKVKVDDRVAASIALDYFISKRPEIKKQEGLVDDAIIALAKKLGAAVGTMDKGLSSKAKKKGIKIIKIRQKKYLR